MLQPLSILRQASFFAFLDTENQTKLSQFAVVREFPKGTLIFSQGDPCPGIYIIAEGSVRIFKNNAFGKEHVLHLLKKHEVFAEVAVMGNFPCPANAEALTATTCILLPSENFRKVIEADHSLCLQMLASMALRMRQIIGHVEGIVLKEGLNRVAGYLAQEYHKQGGEISLPSFKKHLACHLNLTSETLSRILKQLRSEGLITEVRNNKFAITDIKALESASICD
jgi:CRP/FNR family transcriptional regulator